MIIILSSPLLLLVLAIHTQPFHSHYAGQPASAGNPSTLADRMP